MKKRIELEIHMHIKTNIFILKNNYENKFNLNFSLQI